MLTHFSHPFHLLLFYKLLTFLPYVDCYIQFSYSTSYNMTSSSFFNSFNCPFFIFFIPFWFSICYSSPLLTPFSHPFHILLFYNFLTLISYVDCYIQFHFLTCSSMTSSSFFNSLNSPFLFFYAWFWYQNCYSSLLLTPFSHPFHILLFYKLFTSLPCIDYYIQFPFLTRSSMTSSSFSNSFNCPFLFFYACFWYQICYSSPLLTPFSHPFHIFVFYELFTFLPCVDCYIQFQFLTRSSMTSSSFSNSFNCPFFIFLCTLWYTF